MIDGDAFEAHYSPWRSAMFALLSLGFLAVSLWMVGAFGEVPTGSRRIPDWAVPYVGWLGIIFSGPFSIAHARRIFVPGLAVRVDRVGMLVDGYGADPIAWSEITTLHIWDFRGNKALQFDFSEHRVSRMSLPKRILRKVNSPLGRFDGWLAINNTNRKDEELIEALRRFAPPHLAAQLR